MVRRVPAQLSSTRWSRDIQWTTARPPSRQGTAVPAAVLAADGSGSLEGALAAVVSDGGRRQRSAGRGGMKMSAVK